MGCTPSKAYPSALDTGVTAALEDVLAAVAAEKPADPIMAIANKLAAKAGKAPLPPATSDLMSTIGNTPMIKLGKMLPAGCKAKAVYVKMEMQNPGGSVKDRIAKNMLEEAEKAGKLKPGMTVVEGTSGNTGIGLAMACAAKGYKCIIMMPQVKDLVARLARSYAQLPSTRACTIRYSPACTAVRDLISRYSAPLLGGPLYTRASSGPLPMAGAAHV